LITTTRGHRTTTTLSIRPIPAKVNETVTLTAKVVAEHAAANPASGGLVGFFAGQKLLGSVVLKSGMARLNLADLPAGRHAITAVFQGGSFLLGSTSDDVTLTVEAPIPLEEDLPPLQPYSYVMMPDCGHLLTLESRPDVAPLSLRTLAAKSIDVPTSFEEFMLLQPSSWKFALPFRSEVYLASADVDGEGIHEPLIEVRSVKTLPNKVATQTIDESGSNPGFRLRDPAGYAAMPAKGYTGGVLIKDAFEVLFQPNTTTSRVPTARLLSSIHPAQGKSDQLSIPVIAASRKGPMIRIAASDAPMEMPPTPVQSTIEPVHEDDMFDMGNLFVG